MQDFKRSCQVISEVAMADAVEKVGQATTIMFCHYPRKQSAHEMAATVEQHVTRAAFNFVYVPWDRNANSNMGYGFVNFVDPATAQMVYALMEGMVWPNDTRQRQMKLAPARVQGLNANLMRYAHGLSTPDFMHCPLIFSNGVEVPLCMAVQNLYPSGGLQQFDYNAQFVSNTMEQFDNSSFAHQPWPGMGPGYQAVMETASQASNYTKPMQEFVGNPSCGFSAAGMDFGRQAIVETTSQASNYTNPMEKLVGNPASGFNAAGLVSGYQAIMETTSQASNYAKPMEKLVGNPASGWNASGMVSGNQAMVDTTSQSNSFAQPMEKLVGNPTSGCYTAGIGSEYQASSYTKSVQQVVGCPPSGLDATGFASASTTASFGDRSFADYTSGQEGEKLDAVLRSPAYLAAWSQVNTLLGKLQDVGAI